MTDWASAALVAPSVILIAVFIYGFIGFTGCSALAKWNSLTPDFTFLDQRDFARLFTTIPTDRVLCDLRNTVTFTLLFLFASISLGLFLAVLLDRRVKGEGSLRNIFLFTMAVSSIVAGIGRRWILSAVIVLGRPPLKIFDLVVSMTGPGPAFYLMPISMQLVTGMKSFQEVSLAPMWSLLRRISFRELLSGVVWRIVPGHSPPCETLRLLRDPAATARPCGYCETLRLLRDPAATARPCDYGARTVGRLLVDGNV